MGIKRSGSWILLFLLCSISILGADSALLSIIEENDMRLYWDSQRSLGVVRSGKHSLTFKAGFPGMVKDYATVLPEADVYFEQGVLKVSEKGVDALESLAAAAIIAGDVPRIAAILIDPGHGGRDPGTIGRHKGDKGDEEELILQEKDIVLDVSLDVFRRLMKRFTDKRIILTRNSDSYPSLEERVDMANEVELGTYEAIIFVSIHANASLNSGAKGFEVWYLPPDFRRSVLDPESVDDGREEILPILNTMLEEEYTVESILLARNILEGINGAVGELTEDRGLKEETWFVVRNAKMPSVLVELGFVTNKEEAELLADQDYLMKLSEGIYNGIVDFITYFESTKGFTE